MSSTLLPQVAADQVDSRNSELLKTQIRKATGWESVGSIYANGRPLVTAHAGCVHRAMCDELPLVVLAVGETYDKAHWAEIAEKSAKMSRRCTIS